MDVDHNTLVAFAKSGGLFYLIAFSIGVLIYTFWPSNKKKFDRAKHDVLEQDDRPSQADATDPGDQSLQEDATEQEDRTCQ